MKLVIAFAALVAVCAAAPIDPDQGAVVLRDTRTNDGIHGYQFDYETSNGISRSETGTLRSAGEGEVVVVEGQAAWTSPEGVPVAIKFVADEHGYQPII